MWPKLERPRPALGLWIGLLILLAVVVILIPLNDSVTRAVPALLLVLPVVASAVIG